MDIRVIEENKRKYLDMLTTKLFLNEEEVVGLTKGAKKAVVVICPLCSKQKVRCYADISRAGHTLCSSCSKSIKITVPLLGTRKGRLLIFDIASPHKTTRQVRSRLKAICDCGVVKDYLTHELKSTGETLSCGCLNREINKARVGELNPAWDPSLTDEDRVRGRNKTGPWTRAVKIKDNFTCQVCGSTEKLVAHHLNSYKSDKDARFDIENGITLCRDCHTDFHVNFMGNYRVPCTSEDFEEYLIQV